MSIQAVAWVLDHSKSRLADRLVLISIANHTSRDLGSTWISYQTMGEEAGVSRREAIRAVQSLVTLGELEVQKAAGPTGSSGGSPLNVYRIVGMVTNGHPGASQSDRQGDVRPLLRVTPPSPVPRTNHKPGFQPKTGKAWVELSVDQQEALIRAT